MLVYFLTLWVNFVSIPHIETNDSFSFSLITPGSHDLKETISIIFPGPWPIYFYRFCYIPLF